MLVYKFHYGAGDREADKVTDDLILTEQMAHARAVQELCDTFKIVIERELRVVMTPGLELGEKRDVIVPHLGINAECEIKAVTTTLSPSGCYDEVTMHEYKDMR